MVEPVKQLSRIGFDIEKGMYWGEILHLCATETFQAGSVDELRQLLRESVLDRHEDSGMTAASSADLLHESLVIELDPTLRYQLNQQAILHGKSLNQFVLDILEESVDRSQVPELV